MKHKKSKIAVIFVILIFLASAISPVFVSATSDMQIMEFTLYFDLGSLGATNENTPGNAIRYPGTLNAVLESACPHDSDKYVFDGWYLINTDIKIIDVDDARRNSPEDATSATVEARFVLRAERPEFAVYFDLESYENIAINPNADIDADGKAYIKVSGSDNFTFLPARLIVDDHAFWGWGLDTSLTKNVIDTDDVRRLSPTDATSAMIRAIFYHEERYTYITPDSSKTTNTKLSIPTNPTKFPLKRPKLGNIMISASESHTVGLKNNGTVVAVGRNADRQCNVSKWTDIVAVSTGYGHTVGLKNDGTVVAVGDNEDGQCDVSSWTDIVAISAGAWNTVGLKDDGTVVAVGDNEDGQCDVSEWKNVVAIYSISSHPFEITVGLKNDGAMIYSNVNSDYQAYNIDEINAILSLDDSVSTSAGLLDTIMRLKKDGTIDASRYMESDVPINDDLQDNISLWTNVAAVSSSNNSIFGLRADGTVLGVTRITECDTSSWNNIIAISTGNTHVVGLKKDGTVVAVGDNEDGQCDTIDWQLKVLNPLQLLSLNPLFIPIIGGILGIIAISLLLIVISTYRKNPKNKTLMKFSNCTSGKRSLNNYRNTLRNIVKQYEVFDKRCIMLKLDFKKHAKRDNPAYNGYITDINNYQEYFNRLVNGLLTSLCAFDELYKTSSNYKGTPASSEQENYLSNYSKETLKSFESINDNLAKMYFEMSKRSGVNFDQMQKIMQETQENVNQIRLSNKIYNEPNKTFAEAKYDE